MAFICFACHCRRRFNVSEGTLRCLLALPLRVREDERARAKARVKSKNRKRRKEGSVEAGLMEADARLDDDVRAKCEADALHEVRADPDLNVRQGCWQLRIEGIMSLKLESIFII